MIGHVRRRVGRFGFDTDKVFFKRPTWAARLEPPEVLKNTPRRPILAGLEPRLMVKAVMLERHIPAALLLTRTIPVKYVIRARRS